MSERVVVRKYGNRRLYNTSTSRYINLEELADLVLGNPRERVAPDRPGSVGKPLQLSAGRMNAVSQKLLRMTQDLNLAALTGENALPRRALDRVIEQQRAWAVAPGPHYRAAEQAFGDHPHLGCNLGLVDVEIERA